MKYITRFEYGNTRGWWVRIRRKPNPCSRLFSDGKHGGKASALEAALAWRDEMLARHPPVASVAVERRHKQIKTGVTGLYVSLPKRAGGTMPALGVSIIDQTGRHLVRSFSIRKWGLRRALWKACSAIAQGRATEKRKALQLAHDLYARAYKQLEGVLEEALPSNAGDTVAALFRNA